MDAPPRRNCAWWHTKLQEQRDKIDRLLKKPNPDREAIAREQRKLNRLIED